MAESQKCVAHFVGTFLFLHGTWIYSQINSLRSWRALVICGQTQNLDVFPVERLCALERYPLPSRALNRVARRTLGYHPAFAKAIEREGADVIHAHFGPQGYGSLGLAKRTGARLVTTFYGYDLSRLPRQEPGWRERYRRLFAEGDLFLVEGPHMREQLIELGCPADKAKIQRLGVDLGRLPLDTREPDADGSIRVLVAGNLTEKKGMAYALEAFARVARARPEMRLTLIGNPADAVEGRAIRAQLDEIVERNALQSRVTISGPVPYAQLIREFYRHHIMLAPSVHAANGDNEGGAPVTIIEASASGMPVLATTHCDIPQVVLNGESGYLVAERDVDALADRLEQLASQPESWPSMGRAGRHHVERIFDTAAQALELERHYDALTG